MKPFPQTPSFFGLSHSGFLALLLICSAPAFADVKIATWNLNWLTLRSAGDPALPPNVHPRRTADFKRLRAFADRLDADIVAFEEVDGGAAAATVFDPARYQIVTITQDVVQRVGLAVRHGITVQRNADIAALDVESNAPHQLRDGLDASVVFPDGATLRILVIHLKTGCHRDDLQNSHRPQCALLAAQIPIVADWARARAGEKIPFAIMGDFNREMDRPDAVVTSLASAAPMLRVTEGHGDPCWDGGPFIDHLFLGGPARGWLVPGSLRVLTFNSTDPADRERLSDHCPVSVRIDPR